MWSVWDLCLAKMTSHSEVFWRFLIKVVAMWDASKASFKTTATLFLGKNLMYLWLKLILIYNNTNIFTNLGNLFQWLLSLRPFMQQIRIQIANLKYQKQSKFDFHLIIRSCNYVWNIQLSIGVPRGLMLIIMWLLTLPCLWLYKLLNIHFSIHLILRVIFQYASIYYIYGKYFT